jgi:hypothetical protein
MRRLEMNPLLLTHRFAHLSQRNRRVRRKHKPDHRNNRQAGGKTNCRSHHPSPGPAWEQLKEAEQRLVKGGHQVHLAIRAGEVEPTLHAYQLEQGIDLLVMGAYGHSRIRQFLVGSTTSHLLRTSTSPLLILR